MSSENPQVAKPEAADDHVVIEIAVDTKPDDAMRGSAVHPLKQDTKKPLNKAEGAAASASRSFSRYDDGLLHRAVEDAGRWAYGTIFVEIWALNEDRTFLFRPEAGWWVDPVYHRECGENCQICRLTNSGRADFVPPVPLTPGVGLPGVLWAETGHGKRSWFGSHNSQSRRRFRSDASQVFYDATAAPMGKMVVWREVKAIANDPDQPWNPRLQLLASLGLGWVAAVDFDMHGHSGIVVYMAREDVDLNRLQSESNEAYLMAASDLAAAAYALRGPRRRVVEERRSELVAVMRRVKNKILAAKRMGLDLGKLIEDNAAAASNERKEELPVNESCSLKYVKKVRQRLETMLLKARGGGVQPPPAMAWQQTFLTFIGCFVTLLMLTRLNVHVVEQYGSDYAIVLGPFGALMTLLYGLSAAPASQPRNAIVGQAISLTISICVGYADILTVWMRQSLATSLAIAAMVKLGVTHPPAGAAALLYASGSYGWGNMLFMLIGNVIAIGAATLINNWSDTRQYPSYWGLPMVEDMVGKMQAAEAKKAA